MLLQTAADRPDVVARVFRLKLKAILEDLLENDMLGEVIVYIYVIEFQKRGLPHAHILLIMASRHLLRNATQYDTVVSAELPDKLADPELFETVSKCAYTPNLSFT